VIQCRATAVAGCTAESRLLHGGRVRAAICDDDVRRECRNFRSVFPDAVCITGTPTVLDPQIAAYDPAQFLQPLGKRGNMDRCIRIVRRDVHEHADAPHPLRPLRLRRKGACDRAGKSSTSPA
jgi:hypothetical protein